MPTILSGTCNSFKLECWQALHDLSADTVKAALYASSADMHPGITAYTSVGEATDTNWPAGGVSILTASGYPKLVRLGPEGMYAAAWAFQDKVVPNVTITFRSILLYNASKSNRAIAVLDKGIDTVITAGSVTLFTNPLARYVLTSL